MPQKDISKRKNKITILFFIITVLIGLFIYAIFKTVSTHRKLPSSTYSTKDRSTRGSIISKDGYTLSTSQKTYQAEIYGRNINPDKKELFVKLFSIYSDIPVTQIEKKLMGKDKKPILDKIILSKNIDAQTAMGLRSLSHKLNRLSVFKPAKNKKGKINTYGLDIIENREKREYPLKDILSPVLGYTKDIKSGKYMRPVGIKGIEKFYEKYMNTRRDGYLKGERDVSQAIIHNKNSYETKKINGMDIHLNISLSVQRRIELMIDSVKNDIWSDEILIGIMESGTGNVLALASTERFAHQKILETNKDIVFPKLNPKFTEYPHEAGSVLKPIIAAIALEKNLITPDTWFNTNYKKFHIGNSQMISDDELFESLTTTGIITHSSNIGISKIAWKLSAKDFRDGLLKFGFSRPSGIELSRDLVGKLKPIKLLEKKVHRANTAYGYGNLVTFVQLFKAYSAFNNEGIAVTPRLVHHLKYINDAKQYEAPINPGDFRAISKETAKKMHKMLQNVVQNGTGKKAQYPSLEIGGKTGTAHIAKNGVYINKYHSSFYGFANDEYGHKYTIGVLVMKAKKGKSYFASKSAVPTFKRAVDILVELEYLKPTDDIHYTSKKLSIKEDIHLPKKSDIDKNDINSSIKDLFKIKTIPSTKKSPKELFQNLF